VVLLLEGVRPELDVLFEVVGLGSADSEKEEEKVCDFIILCIWCI
jgi:hypothetical protein